MLDGDLIYSVSLQVSSRSKLTEADVNEMAGRIIEAIAVGQSRLAIYAESGDLVQVRYVRSLPRFRAMS